MVIFLMRSLGRAPYANRTRRRMLLRLAQCRNTLNQEIDSMLATVAIGEVCLLYVLQYHSFCYKTT
jgi:hypothetical protein